ncbi:hypothetical protein KBC89_04010 [Candidatus Woesebacteria bacterium]|nr:hypothetical protein [Candidatus Woesebacteria bacterium]
MEKRMGSGAMSFLAGFGLLFVEGDKVVPSLIGLGLVVFGVFLLFPRLERP